MTKKQKIKNATVAVAGFCASAVATHVIVNNTMPKNNFKRVEYAIGAVVIGSLVGSIAEKHIAKTFDEIASSIEKEKTKQTES